MKAVFAELCHGHNVSLSMSKMVHQSQRWLVRSFVSSSSLFRGLSPEIILITLRVSMAAIHKSPIEVEEPLVLLPMK
jgi:hypothetical protein